MPTSKPLRGWIEETEPRPDRSGSARVERTDPPGRPDHPRRSGRGREGHRGLLGSAKAAGAAVHWTADWLRAGERAARAVEAELAGESEPSEPGVHALLGRLYADGDLVYTASSMPIRDQESFLAAAPTDVTFLCNRGANGIDGLISSGAGAAAATGRPWWIVTGDLGLVHDAAGLAAVGGGGLPVRVIVIDNDGGGIFEFLPQAELLERAEFEALFGTPSGVKPKDLAQVHGLEHRSVERLDAIQDAAAAGTGMIEIRTGRRRNVEIHQRISSRVADELGKP